jgi:antitoxin CptB
MADRAALDRLKWKCRRGLLELDIVLGRFLAKRATSLSDEELVALNELLDAQDNDLWDVVNGRSEQFEARHRALVDELRAS